MATEENNSTESNTTTDSDTDTNSTRAGALASLFNAYKEKKGTSKERVFSKLVDLMVEREETEQVALLDAGIKKLAEAEREVKKIKPDHVIKDASGKTVVEGFTADQQKKLSDAQGKQKRLNDALNQALESGDYNKLKELAK